ncbi:MAG: hypothetical protein ACRDK0_01225 [Solirubrobacteraceae bacterium]
MVVEEHRDRDPEEAADRWHTAHPADRSGRLVAAVKACNGPPANSQERRSVRLRSMNENGSQPERGDRIDLADPLLTAEGIGELLGIPRRRSTTTRGASNPLPCLEIGRHRRFFRSDVERRLDDQRPEWTAAGGVASAPSRALGRGAAGHVVDERERQDPARLGRPLLPAGDALRTRMRSSAKSTSTQRSALSSSRQDATHTRPRAASRTCTCPLTLAIRRSWNQVWEPSETKPPREHL